MKGIKYQIWMSLSPPHLTSGESEPRADIWSMSNECPGNLRLDTKQLLGLGNEVYLSQVENLIDLSRWKPMSWYWNWCHTLPHFRAVVYFNYFYLQFMTSNRMMLFVKLSFDFVKDVEYVLREGNVSKNRCTFIFLQIMRMNQYVLLWQPAYL